MHSGAECVCKYSVITVVVVFVSSGHVTKLWWSLFIFTVGSNGRVGVVLK